MHFSNRILSYSNVGATSLFTTVGDMALWAMNFNEPKLGDKLVFKQLIEKGKLNNGKESPYASGLFIDTYKGWRQYSHSGGDAGYRAYMAVFPDLKLSIIVFSNLADLFNTGNKAYEIADLFIKDTTQIITVSKLVEADSSKAIIKDTSVYEGFVGSYIGNEGSDFSIYIQNKKLYTRWYGQDYLLYPENKDTLALFVMPWMKFVLGYKNSFPSHVEYIFAKDKPVQLERYERNKQQSDKNLQLYTGTYYSPELDVIYRIVLRNHKLFLTNNKIADAQLRLLNNRHLVTDEEHMWSMSHLLIKRNVRGGIDGFEVNKGRVMHLIFNRIKLP